MDVMSTSGKITKGQRVNEWRQVEGSNLLVNKYSICSTTIVCYAVWERTESSAFGFSHSTITHEEGKGWLGDVTTRQLPADMDALPACTEERSKAVRGWHAANEQEARAAVLATFPEDF